MKIYTILAAGGSGTRMMASRNKLFLNIDGQSVLMRSIRLFEGFIDAMTIVYRKPDLDAIRDNAAKACVTFPITFTEGGATRQESVLNGLRNLPADPADIVLIHDAARCMTPPEVISEVIASCKATGSGVAGIPAVNTMKYADENHHITRTIDRNGLYEIQTPQGFLYGELLKAYLDAEKNHCTATDDASLMELSGKQIVLTRGSRMNIKITEKEDLSIASSFLKPQLPLYRIGSGYDVHKLVQGRKLILCGVEIPHTLGLLGHSDADVALHALMDAMLGALSLGDIGKHFPDSSPTYKDISSLTLLKEVYEKVCRNGYVLENADVTIAAQRPKISSFIPEMIHKISDLLAVKPDQVSIKATTTEKLGFEGREEGISAQAVCLLRRADYSAESNFTI